jgi:hypothetical protein
MGVLKNRKRSAATLSLESFDTVARMSFDTMIDRSKIVNKALDEYLERNGYEIRLNTPEENEKIFPDKK